MNNTNLNGDLLTKLKGIDYPLVIRNEAGEPIGIYLPIDSYRGMQRALGERIPCPFTAEELERRRQEEGGSSLEELWRKVGRQ